MSFCGLSLATLFLTCAAGRAVAAEAAKPCQLEEIASVDFSFEPSGSIAIPAEINGKAGNFGVDTGGISDALSETVAHDLGMPAVRGNGEMIYLGGVPASHFTTADTFKIGNLVGTKRVFLLVSPHLLEGDMIGMLGPSTLTNYDIEIDFAKGKFNFFKPGECSSHAIYWTHDPAAAVPITLDEIRHMSIPITINGRTVKADVDTGAGDSVMDIDTAAYVLGTTTDDPKFKSMGDIGMNGKSGTEGFRVQFPPLTFEGIGVTNPNILVIGNTHMGSRGPRMILGMNILRHLHMYIAYQKRLLFLTAAEAH